MKISEHLHKKVDRNSAFFTQKVGKMTLFEPDERKTQPKTSPYLSQQNSEIIWFSLVFKK